MAKNDMMNVSATNERENDSNNNNNNIQPAKVAKDFSIRTGNRLKKGISEFGEALAAVAGPVKSKLIVIAIIVAAALISLILITAAYKYLLEVDSIKADDKKTEILKEANLLNAEYLYGYKGQTSDLEEFAETVEFFLKEEDKVFTRVATTSRAKEITTLDNFLFIGDSRYDGLDTLAIGNNIKNQGVTSATINEWIKVVQGQTDTVQGRSVDIKGEYAGISIQLGVNTLISNDFDEAYNKKIVDAAVVEMQNLIDGLQKIHPTTPIFVNSCVQVHPKAQNNDDYKNWNAGIVRNNINNFNKSVEEYCNTANNVYYIDVSSKLNDSDGYLADNFTTDGLHCNTAGQTEFLKNIKNAITKSGASSNNTQNNSSQGSVSGGRTTETITIKYNEEAKEYRIVEGLNDKVQKIYDSLKEEKNLLLKRFKDEEHAKRSIKLWIIAEYSSQYVNLSPDVENYKHNFDDEDKLAELDYIQGIVKVKRYGIDENGNEISKYLTYVHQEKFEELKENYRTTEDATVFNHFTINEKDDLVIATYSIYDIKSSWTGVEDSKQPIPEADNDRIIEITDMPLNYRSQILPYTMPYFLFVTLTMYGENADFSNDIAKLILGSEMEIGVRDNVTTEITTTVDKYLREEFTYEKAKVTAKVWDESRHAEGQFYKYLIMPSEILRTSRDAENEFVSIENNTKLQDVNETSYYEKTTVRTRISNYVAMGLEYIDGWCFNHKITYEAKDETTETTDTNNIENTEYVTTNEYSTEPITTHEGGKPEIVSKNGNLNTIFDEAVNNIKSVMSNSILEEYYHHYIAVNQNNDGYYYILADCDFPYMALTGDTSHIENIDKKYLEAIGVEIESDEQVEDIKNGVWNAYYRGTSKSKEDIINEKITTIVDEYRREEKERIVNATKTITVNTNRKEYNKTSTQAEETTAKTDKKGEEGENFVSILSKDKYKKVKHILTGSTSSWFFETLEKEEETIGLVDLMKYLFYKTTNKDYGVKEFDFSKGLVIIDTSNFHSTGVIAGDTIQAKVWFAVKALGYDDEHAAAVMGNIHWESGGFATTAVESNGVGIGLIQWSFGRRTQLEAYAASKGVDWRDEDTQVEFLVAEMTPGGGANGCATYQFSSYNGYSPENWYNATTIEEATKAFCWTFERPNVALAHIAERIQWANHYYDEFHGKTLMGATGGEYIAKASAEDGIYGYFYSDNGRVFTVYNQCAIPGWLHYCNKAAAASILSAYRKPGQLDMDVAYAMNDPHSPLATISDTKSIFEEYGLKASYGDRFDRNKMESTLKSGGYVAIHVLGNGASRFGTKSGFKYTNGNSMHWVAILGYRVANGEEQIMISNSGWYNTSGWVPIDDFAAFESHIDMSWYITE